jgi:hypothetical protein
MRLTGSLTLDAGVRVDWSRLLARESQVSPRAGAAYNIGATDTTVRASAGRFFQPPQPENLLLASSDAAWALSPFRDETGGGAALPPERQTAFELAVSQPLAHGLRLDLAYWRRRMTNVADPNVFFGTTILFPNSVAKGRASGLEVRLEMPRRRGWSGYLSYANSHVVQFGPITGGLFLEDEVIEIGPGTAFTPDHDQRNVGAFGVSFDDENRGFWASVTGRYESGTPLEVEEDDLDELMERPAAPGRCRRQPARGPSQPGRPALGLQLRQSVQRHALRSRPHRAGRPAYRDPIASPGAEWSRRGAIIARPASGAGCCATKRCALRDSGRVFRTPPGGQRPANGTLRRIRIGLSR